MTLSDLASIGSFVSGLAVLVSLIFLNVQVRQTARHQRSMLLQSQASRSMDLEMRLAHPFMAPVWDNAVGKDGELTLREFRQVRHIVTANFKNGEESFFQYRDGLISEAGFDTVRQLVKTLVGFPRVRVIWRQSRALFDPGYVRLVDQLLAAMPLYAPEAALADFNRAVVEEVASTTVASPDEWMTVMTAPKPRR